VPLLYHRIAKGLRIMCPGAPAGAHREKAAVAAKAEG
jgi:hypothetical protein